jgi:hypothetical protein
MKTMFLAAAAALSIGIGSAHAGDGDGPAANTFFTQLPGVIATVPARQAPSAVAANPNGAVTNMFVTKHRAGTWLFPPAQYGG